MVGPAVAAMSNVGGTGQVAVAYQPGGGGDYVVNRWTPPATTLDYAGGTLTGTSTRGIHGVAVDPQGVVWAIDGTGNLWRYASGSAPVSYTLPHYSPSAIAIGNDGMIYITDSSSNVLDVFSSVNISAAAPGVGGASANLLYEIWLSSSPSGVTIVP